MSGDGSVVDFESIQYCGSFLASWPY